MLMMHTMLKCSVFLEVFFSQLKKEKEQNNGFMRELVDSILLNLVDNQVPQQKNSLKRDALRVDAFRKRLLQNV